MRTDPGTHEAQAGRTATMRAVVQDEYGEADVLRLEEIDRPSIGDDEVLVRVRAAGVDQGAWHLMAGLPYPIRLAGFGVRAPKRRVRGRELAGSVEAVGAGVTALRPGDDVFGIGEGTFAEYAVASPDRLVRTPAGLSSTRAAALGVSALTALQAVRDQAQVQAGERVLVIGASGGVGTFAVQLAKAFGAEVTGVASGSKLEVVRSIGADHVVDHRSEDVTAGGVRYDVVLDTGGNTPLRRLRRILTPNGRLVIVGAETGGRWLGGLGRQLRAMLLNPFTGQRLGSFIASENAADLAVLAGFVAAGQVTPVVDRTFALDEVPEAMRYLRAGRATGKVVVEVDGARRP
jgi:NADPH:quinone reductase-like Zn-dependent oxidoreductase